MTAETATHEDATHAAQTPHAAEAHPNHVPVYVQTALALAVITGIETLTYFESAVDFGRLTMPLLIVCMITKFYLIAANFMHLRWDKPILRRAFVGGIVIALTVYLIMLLAFKFFEDPNFMPH